MAAMQPACGGCVAVGQTAMLMRLKERLILRLLPLSAFAAILGLAVLAPVAAHAAVTMEPPAIVETASDNALIMPVGYYWHGRAYPYRWRGGYYAYRWHGGYYRHRRWRNGLWFYY
jgi:hypothetical protein